MTIKFVADISPVREVTLSGAADLAYWTERLTKENLQPLPRDGRAQVLIVAVESRYLGIPFRELSFSVIASEPGDYGRDGAFLVRAFNSNRLFTFCERNFFSTPYHHADVFVKASYPPSIRLSRRGAVVFVAEAGRAHREPVRRGPGGWHGPVFLPRNERDHDGRAFVAKLHGQTDVYPFFPALDSSTIRPMTNDDAFQELLDSQFVATEWSIRENARHAKSKTYRRSKLPSQAEIVQ